MSLPLFLTSLNLHMIPFKGIVVILLLISSSFSISIFKKVVLQIKIPKLFTSILDFFFYIKNHRCIVNFFGKSYIGNILKKKLFNARSKISTFTYHCMFHCIKNLYLFDSYVIFWFVAS